MTKEEAASNLQMLIDVCIKKGNIFENSQGVGVMLQSLGVLADKSPTVVKTE